MPAVDFNNPRLNTNYTQVLEDLKERNLRALSQWLIQDAADANIPTNAVRFNPAVTGDRWQKYDGATWVDLITSTSSVKFANIKLGARPSVSADMEISHTAHVTAGREYVIRRVSAGGTSVNSAKAQSLELKVDDVTSLEITPTDIISNFVIRPSADNTLDLGTDAMRFQTGHFVNLGSVASPIENLYINAISPGAGSDAIINAPLGQSVKAQENGVDRWIIEAGTGHQLPALDDTYNLGSTAFEILETWTKSVYSGGAIRVRAGTTLTLGSGNTDRWTIENTAGHLHPNTNGLTDLGNNTRYVRTAYLSRLRGFADRTLIGDSVSIGNWTSSTATAYFGHQAFATTANAYALLQNNAGHTYLNCASGQNLYLRNAANDAIVIGASVATFYTTPIPNGNAALDLGIAANHWRNVYSANFQNQNDNDLNINQVANRNVNIITNNLTRWLFINNGTFRPNTNGLYDIGSSTRAIKDLYFANKLIYTPQNKTWFFWPDSLPGIDSVNPEAVNQGVTQADFNVAIGKAVNYLAEKLIELGLLTERT